MQHRIKEIKNKIRSAGGFTLVELVVVLVILAILAALAGAGLIAYTRMARFEHNEANARTMFQTAQIALTRKDTSGDMDDFLTNLSKTGAKNNHFTAEGLQEQFGDAAADKAKDLNSRIVALYYDKTNTDTEASRLVRDLLDPYVYDESLFNASIVLEIDSLTGQVYSAFYDTSSEKMRFSADADADGATIIDDRTYAHRRSDSLVGYYSAEDTVNVVTLSQTRLKVKNPQLINNETLTLNWSGNSKYYDIDTIYDAVFYNADSKTPLFKMEIIWADVIDKNKNARIKVYFNYDADNDTWKDSGTEYSFPLSYSSGRFILTLDAMCDATLLRAAENYPAAASSSLFSITRLTQGAQDIYVEMKARPNANYEDAYTESKPVTSNTENTLFAAGSDANNATLKYFRHLYNLRWVDSGSYTFNNKALLGNQNTTLDWTDGSVTVYCAAEDGGEPNAKVPSRTGDVVAWPTIPALGENVALTGSLTGSGHVVISNLQLRGTSVAAQERLTGPEYLKNDHYVGLIGENSGTLSKITLRDPDVQVNAEVKSLGEQADTAMPMNANNTQYLQVLDKNSKAYREDIRAVGALAGVDTGTVTDCTVDRSNRRGAEAKVTAALTFGDSTTGTNRVNGTNVADEPHGIGGLVGFAMPTGTAALSNLTLDQNVTVAGLFTDTDAAKNSGMVEDASADTVEKERYNAVANQQESKTLWRAVGVGGVAGVLDATNLADADGTVRLTGITNQATVVGNAFAGGIAGNLYATGNTSITLTGLTNQGTVLAGANYEGAEAGKSAVLGQFFGGIAGYASNLDLTKCTSATRSGLSETALTTLVRAGYDEEGALNESSPLKGDFVGGLVGFGRNIQMLDCRTESGYVLGRSFVGGFVGGFVGSDLETKNGVNNSSVFGNRYVGGIVSVNGLNSTIENMTNRGLVAGLGRDAAYVGGIAGVNDATWGLQENNALTDKDTAALVDSANSMSTVEATDKNRMALLQQLSQTADGTAHYADFVGGVAGYNGTNGQIHWTKDSANGATLGAVLYGGSFVGGVAGYNDATAAITNDHDTIPSVTGRIVATGDCVGGVIGLNGAAALPAVQVSANRIEGVHFVGGVIGANLPDNDFTFTDDALGKATPATTIGTGRLVADGAAGGIIGYNRVLPADTLKTALESTENTTIAAALRSLLPGFGSGKALEETGLTSAETQVTLTGLSNQFNIYANAYVGGIIGYNAADTRLTLVNAVNGSQSSAQSYGSLAQSDPNSASAEIANADAYTLYRGVSLGEIDHDYNGYFAGGIIGYATRNTTLENCVNYGGVQHPVAAGGLAGVNDGTIVRGSMANSMGNQQNNYRYLGGIAGINNGSITNAAPAAGSTIRGGWDIGGVAGYNTGSITLDSATGKVEGITATGGVAGYNLGSIVAKSVAVQVSGTTQTGGVAGLNAKGGTIGIDPNASGSYAMTIETGTTVASANQGGGVAGRNEGLIQYITNQAGSIQVTNQYAGGLAGSNSGRIYGCRHSASGSRVLYTGGGYAGGITGCNEAGGVLEVVTVNGSVTAANGEAGGTTAHNYGTIATAIVYNADIRGTSDAIGGVAACNEPNATITGADLRNGTGGGVRLYGPATRVGGLVGYNAGTLKNSRVREDSLSLAGLTASANTVTAGGAVGENIGTVGDETNAADVKVAVDLQDNMDKYCNLGGVAGSNSGTLVQCTYTGSIGTGTSTGMAAVGSTVGGIVGSNDAAYTAEGTLSRTGTVKNCTVLHIVLEVQGASNVGASQDAAAKLSNAAHIGGIVGRNSGSIEGSIIGTDTGSSITARNGFVGGVAGSNSGTITTSGGNGTQELVSQINTWLAVPYVKDEAGNPTTTVDTDKQNENLNAMVRVLTGKASGTTETDWQTKFTNRKGTDAISNSTASNELTITLQGGSSRGDFANGYLGGVAGFNDVNGQITNSASGKWFVYADNINQSWGAVGGIIGQNESNVSTTSGLVNFAAVRRFVRGIYETDDDDANITYYWWKDNDRYDTGDNSEFDNYVGGVIGTQQNRTGDSWILQNCVNVGTVFNSRSNNAGGVLAYWLGYGGTLNNCYNFGTITTNANSTGDASGTVGGIAGYFSAPVAGTAANLYRCSNYGSVGMKTYGANDVGGIFGKVEMDTAHTDDAMTINIIECVNGANVSLKANSMAVGIFGYLGPWGSVPNVQLNITRCRNYCVAMDANNYKIGIAGNRGDGNYSNEYTAINDCFTLAMDTWANPIAYARYYPILDAYGRLQYDEKGRLIGEYREKLKGSGNYYMTVSDSPGGDYTNPSSFAGYTRIDGLQNGLGRIHTTGAWNEPETWPKDENGNDIVQKEREAGSWGSNQVNAHRLYAGKDSGANAATDGENTYTYFAMLPKIAGSTPVVYLPALTPDATFITVERGKSFSDPSAIRYILASDAYDYIPDSITNYMKGYAGKILLLFNDTDNSGNTSKDDITDEVLQRYYSNILDNDVPQMPQNLKVDRSDDTGTTDDPESVYGRYSVTWKANENGSPATYYHITVYETNGNGEPTGTILLETDAYDTRFTFEGSKDWQGLYFNVAVAGVNSKGTGDAATLDEAQRFTRALPAPELQVRLMLVPNRADDSKFSQMLVLKNADVYAELMQSEGLTDWTVTARVAQGETFTFTNADTAPKRIAEGLGSVRRVTAEATSNSTAWMRSGQYDDTMYAPVAWVGYGGTNSGLVQGSLEKKDVQITGSSIDNLTVTVTLKFNASVSGTLPVYRVMLMGRYTGNDTVTLDGQTVSIKNQYVTLAAQQATVPNSDTKFEFKNLPDDALTHYDNLTVVAVPYNSGQGDVVTRWDATETEALEKLQASTETRPASWYGGLEIVRNGSSYSFANLTPLYFVNLNATDYPNWANKATSQVLFEQNKITVAQAPQLADSIAYNEEKLAADNQLEYTFTWKQPGETATNGGSTKYKLTLYGVTETTDADGNVHTAEEVITLPDTIQIDYDIVSGTYRYTLNVDTDLATDDAKTNGSNNWRFDKVRLRVTRDTTTATGSNGIGAADTATYPVLRRLRQVGQPDSVVYVETDNAEQIRYQIRWPAVADERVDHYELWARRQKEDGSLGDAFELHPVGWTETDPVFITDTQTTVDLEAYQNQTLVFYVVACPAADNTTVLRSPNGAESEPQSIIQRTNAPEISKVTFTWAGKLPDEALPLMNTFCQDLTIQMDVGDGNAASYFFTGYLFDTAESYNNACALANAWMQDRSKANLDALNSALADATLMIPSASGTVGSETQRNGTTVSYTVTPNTNAFTMQPTDANRYLLPALRAMVANNESAATSSAWTFFVPQDYESSALQLPKVQLDKPAKDGILSLTDVTSTVKGWLYEIGDTLWSPDPADITITQFAVQWPAVNEYTAQDGTTRNFAQTYRFHVTTDSDMPENDPNALGYDIRFTVAPADTTEKDADGSDVEIHRGQILTVEKLPAGLEDKPENWLDITSEAKHQETDADGNETTWYDLSIAEVDVEETTYDESGNAVTTTVKKLLSQPVVLTGHHAIGNDDPIYRINAVPALQEANLTDGSFGYRLTLPDMTQRAEDDNNEVGTPDKFTAKIDVWAVGDTVQTGDSEHLEVELNRNGYALNQAEEYAAQPVALQAEPAAGTQPAQPVQNTGTAEDTGTSAPADEPGAGETPATPETASPAA